MIQLASPVLTPSCKSSPFVGSHLRRVAQISSKPRRTAIVTACVRSLALNLSISFMMSEHTVASGIDSSMAIWLSGQPLPTKWSISSSYSVRLSLPGCSAKRAPHFRRDVASPVDFHRAYDTPNNSSSGALLKTYPEAPAHISTLNIATMTLVSVICMSFTLYKYRLWEIPLGSLSWHPSRLSRAAEDPSE